MEKYGKLLEKYGKMMDIYCIYIYYIYSYNLDTAWDLDASWGLPIF